MIICDKYSILIILKMRRNLITRTVLTIWLAWDGLFNHWATIYLYPYPYLILYLNYVGKISLPVRLSSCSRGQRGWWRRWWEWCRSSRPGSSCPWGTCSCSGRPAAAGSTWHWFLKASMSNKNSLDDEEGGFDDDDFGKLLLHKPTRWRRRRWPCCRWCAASPAPPPARWLPRWGKYLNK